jgi:hypothetical protein
VVYTQTGNKTNIQTHKLNSRFKNNRISVLVILVLLFLHPVLVLVCKQKLCLSFTRWLGRLTSFFPLSFGGSCLVSSTLNEVWLVLRFQRSALWTTSHPALELGFHCVCLLGACFFASHLFFGARSEIHQLALCCQHVMLVFWLFSNFEMLFDFGCYSLAQEMSFVDSYLPYFRQRLITCPLLALLHFQSLFTELSHGDHLLAPPPFSDVLRAPYPLCCVFLFSSLFIILFFLLWGRVQSVRGLCWFISRVAVGIPRATYFLTSCFVSSKQVWSRHLRCGSHPVFSL